MGGSSVRMSPRFVVKSLIAMKRAPGTWDESYGALLRSAWRMTSPLSLRCCWSQSALTRRPGSGLRSPQ